MMNFYALTVPTEQQKRYWNHAVNAKWWK